MILYYQNNNVLMQDVYEGLWDEVVVGGAIGGIK